jgi:two-component system response regulator HydG
LVKHKDLNPSVRSISDEAMQMLLSHSWPGNVRELEHAIEHGMVMASETDIETHDLPPPVSIGAPDSLELENQTLALEELVRRAILRALRETRGDKLAAARLLRIDKTTLYRKLKEYQTTG